MLCQGSLHPLTTQGKESSPSHPGGLKSRLLLPNPLSSPLRGHPVGLRPRIPRAGARVCLSKSWAFTGGWPSAVQCLQSEWIALLEPNSLPSHTIRSLLPLQKRSALGVLKVTFKLFTPLCPCASLSKITWKPRGPVEGARMGSLESWVPVSGLTEASRAGPPPP